MIHENGITLTEKERGMLKSAEFSQDRRIAMIFMARPAEGFTFHEILAATGFNQDSVKRSISNMAGAGDISKYKDKFDRFPLVKTDMKKENPDTGIRITCYKWNPRFKKPQSHSEIVDQHKKRKQLDFLNGGSQ
jgi:hypothetical protein